MENCSKKSLLSIMVYTFNLGGRGRWVYEFEARLVYKVSCIPGQPGTNDETLYQK